MPALAWRNAFAGAYRKCVATHAPGRRTQAYKRKPDELRALIPDFFSISVPIEVIGPERGRALQPQYVVLTCTGIIGEHMLRIGSSVPEGARARVGRECYC